MTAKRLNALSNALSKIGKTNGTACPETISNVGPAVYELAICQQLKKMIEARTDAAIKVLIDMRVMFDHKLFPVEPKYNATLFTSDVASLFLTTRTPSTRFDNALFVAKVRLLLPASKHDALTALVSECTKVNAVPHVFTASIVTGEQE